MNKDLIPFSLNCLFRNSLIYNTNSYISNIFQMFITFSIYYSAYIILRRRPSAVRTRWRCPRAKTKDINMEQSACSKTSSSGMRKLWRCPRPRTRDIDTGQRPRSKTSCLLLSGKVLNHGES